MNPRSPDHRRQHSRPHPRADGSRAAARVRRHLSRPRLEPLEDRTLLSGVLTSSATPIVVSSTGPTTQTGMIATTGGVDSYTFTAPTTGLLSIEEDAAPGSSLDSYLTVLDNSQNVLAINDNINAATSNSRVEVQVTAGQTYTIEAAASPNAAPGSSTGAYILTLSNPFANPPTLSLGSSGAGTQPGNITASTQIDSYQMTATVTGGMTITQNAAPGSSLDSSLSVYDSTGRLIQSNDNSSYYTTNSTVQFAVVAGQTYYVQASASANATTSSDRGAYSLTVSTIAADGYGSSFGTATTLTLSSTGAATASGAVTLPGGVEFFQFTAPVSGPLVLELDAPAGSSLNSFLTVYDSSQNVLAVNDDINAPSNTDSRVQVQVTAGDTYYVEAAASPNAFGPAASGAYVLNISSPLVNPPTITLDSSGSGSQAGNIRASGQIDTYQFTATVTGAMTLALNNTPYSYLDGLLSVYDAFGNVIQTSTSGYYGPAEVQFSVVAGQTYYVQAASASGLGTGGYHLSLSTIADDGYGHTFGDATTLTLDATGAAGLSGTIILPGSADYFQFTATVTGGMNITLNDALGSSLDTALYVYDSSGNVLQYDDYNYGSFNSTVSLAVQAGNTYYVEATATPYYYYDYGASSTGAYNLSLSTLPADNYGNDFTSATTLPLDSMGAATRTGVIDLPGNADIFQFTASVSGVMTIDQNAAPGSSLDAALYVFDSSQNLIQSDDYHNGGLNSQVRLSVTVGQTYYVEATASPYYFYEPGAADTGAYTLTVSTMSFANATPLMLSTTGATTQTGAIVTANSHDAYQFTALTTGLLSIEEDAAPDSSLDSYLTVFDCSQNILGSDDNINTTTSNSRVEVQVTAGQTYFIEAAASPNTVPGGDTGAYVLTVTNPFTTATPFAVNASGTGSMAGNIASSGQINTYRLTATVTGGMIVTQSSAPGSGLNSYLSIFDSTGQLLGSNDISSAYTLNSEVDFAVVAGQTYYVQASASPSAAAASATGAYSLQVRTLANDGIGHDINSPTTLTLDGSGAASASGLIDLPGGADFFQVTATTTGLLSIEEHTSPGSGLIGYLAVYDGSQNLITWGGNLNYLSGRDRLAQVQVTAGQTYYIEVVSSSFDTSTSGTGAYSLSITSPFVTAPVLSLDASGSANQSGTITIKGQLDTYQITATVSGAMTVTQAAAPGSLLDSALNVYDSLGNLITSNDYNYGSIDSVVTFAVVAGQTYYVQASASPYYPYFGVANTGAYNLTISTLSDDGCGHDSTTATVLPLDTSGAASISGNIELPGTSDFFQITATVTGGLTINLNDASGSILDSALNVYDDSGNLLQGDDYNYGSLNSTVQLEVVAGNTYYVEATATPYYYFDYGASGTGAYTLTLTTLADDGYSHDFGSATTLTLNGSGSASLTGTIDLPSSADIFQVTAAYTGLLSIEEIAGTGSNLNGVITVYDVNQNYLASSSSINYLSSLDNLVQVQVTAGQTYFIQVSSDYYASGSAAIGAYSLSITSPFATAATIALVGSGTGSQSGAITATGQIDTYQITAIQTGGMTIHLDAASGSGLDTAVSVYDSLGNLIQSNDYSYSSLNSEIQLRVVTGQTYYVQAAASSYYPFFGALDTGAYQLTVSTVPEDGYGTSFGNATVLTPDNKGSVQVSGGIEMPGSIDFFQMTATSSGLFTIEEDAAAGSILAGSLMVYNSSQQIIGLSYYISYPADLNSRVQVQLTAGQTYYIQVAASPYSYGDSSSGIYVLSIQSTFSSATPGIVLDPNGSGQQKGDIQSAGQLDAYAFTATVSGQMAIEADAATNSGLDPYLSVYDGNNQLIGTNDNGGGHYNSRLVFNVTAGNTYYFEVASSSADFDSSRSTGAYELTLFTTGLQRDDGYPHAFADALPLILNRGSAGEMLTPLVGNLTTPGQADFFQFTLAQSAPVIVREASTQGSLLNPFVTVFDAQGMMVSSNGDNSDKSGAVVEFDAVANETYYVEVAGYRTSVGSYQLQIQTSSVGDSFATATPISVQNTGTIHHQGNLLAPLSWNVFEFQAPSSGLLNIALTTPPTSNLVGSLFVYDSAQNYLDSNGDYTYTANVNNVVQVVVTAGQNYYVLIADSYNAAGASQIGAYDLAFNYVPPDNFGQSFTSATPVKLDATGAASLSGALTRTGENDYLQITATVSGQMTVTLDTSSSPLAGAMTIYDGSQSYLTSADSYDYLPTIQASFAVTQGQSYYIEVSPSYSSFYYSQSELQVGSYTLDLSTSASAGTTFANATPLTVDSTGTTTAAGIISVSGSTEMYRFLAPTTGLIRIEQDAAAGSNLDSYLTVFDRYGYYLSANDDISYPSNLNSAVEISVVQGQTYYVQAAASPSAASGTTTGAYDLTVSPVASDGYGNSFEKATPVTLDPTGAANLDGALTKTGQTDYLKFTATVSGQMTITLDTTGSPLAGALTVFDNSNSHTILASADSDGYLSTLDAAFHVTQGQTYYVEVSASSSSFLGFSNLGSYAIDYNTIVPDSYGSSIATATLLPLNSNGPTKIAGAVESVGSEDYFQIIASTSGLLAIEEDAAPGSVLDSALNVYNSKGNLIASNDDISYPDNLNSRVEIQVTAGQTYYIEAGASPYAYYDSGSGNYILIISNPFASASTVALSSTGSGRVAGTIQTPGQTNFYSFTAPVSSQITVEQDAVSGSNLDSYVNVYDRLGNLLASNDDISYPTNLNSLVHFNVVAGQTYYVESGASPYAFSNAATGAYQLTFTPLTQDGYGKTFATATNLGTISSVTLHGTVDTPGRADWILFTAAQSTTMTFEEDAAPGSSLDPYLSLFDASDNRLAANDDDGDAINPLNSRLQLDVVAGQTYCIRVAASALADPDSNTGSYLLTVSSLGQDGYGDSFATATPVVLDSSVFAFRDGQIEQASGVDFFQLVAPVSGTLTVQFSAAVGSTLNGYLLVYNQNQQLITSGGGGSTTQLSFDVIEGQTYYVEAAGAGNSTGEYGLTFAPLQEHDTLSTFSPRDTHINLSTGTNAGTQFGSIEVSGNVDMYQLNPNLTGWITIQDNAVGSGIDPVLTVYNSSQQQIAFNDDNNGTLNSQVQLFVQADQTYYVQASGYGLTAGSYELIVRSSRDSNRPHVEDFGTAESLTLSSSGAASQVGSLARVGNVDMYQLTATVSGLMTVQLAPTSGSNLDASLRAFTSIAGTLTQIAGNDSTTAATGGAQQIQFAVVAGQTYYVRVAGFAGADSTTAVGGYTLSIETNAQARTTSGGVSTAAFQAAANALTYSYSEYLTATGLTPQTEASVAQAVAQAFLNSLGGRPGTDYLIVWLDPVDAIVTDPQQRQTGFTTDQGAVNENSSSSFARLGILQLLVVPNALAGAYNLELTGVGQDQILGGALLVAANGTVTLPTLSTSTGEALGSLSSLNLGQKESLEVVLDFDNPSSTLGALGAVAANPLLTGPVGEGTALAQAAGAESFGGLSPGGFSSAALSIALSSSQSVASAAFSLPNLGNAAGGLGAASLTLLVSGLGSMMVAGPVPGETGENVEPPAVLPPLPPYKDIVDRVFQIIAPQVHYLEGTAATVMRGVAGTVSSVFQPLGLQGLSLSGLAPQNLLEDLASTLFKTRAVKPKLPAATEGAGEVKVPPPAQENNDAAPPSNPSDEEPPNETSLIEHFLEGPEGTSPLLSSLAASLYVCGLYHTFRVRSEADEEIDRPWPGPGL